MKSERMKELLDQVVDHVCIGRNTNDQIEELLKYGFDGKELVTDFNFSAEDVLDVTGEDYSEAASETDKFDVEQFCDEEGAKANAIFNEIRLRNLHEDCLNRLNDVWADRVGEEDMDNIARDAANYCYNKGTDSNLTYWDNLDNFIKQAIHN